MIDQLRHKAKDQKEKSPDNKKDNDDDAGNESMLSNQKNKQDDLIRIIEMNKRWCLEHLDILQSFGRYPHRNKVLGRENTEEEDLYLRDTASFGQSNR